MTFACERLEYISGFTVDGVVDKFQPVTSTIMLEDMNHTEILQADTL
jgi:hypothetical protein